jgi:hypothetical protein
VPARTGSPRSRGSSGRSAGEDVGVNRIVADRSQVNWVALWSTSVGHPAMGAILEHLFGPDKLIHIDHANEHTRAVDTRPSRTRAVATSEAEARIRRDGVIIAATTACAGDMRVRRSWVFRAPAGPSVG